MSWADYGMPITRNEDVNRCLELLRTWYVEYRQYNGGFLHVWAEDGNLYDDQVLPEHAFDIAFEGMEAEVARNHASAYLPRTVTAKMLKQHMGEVIECWRNMDEYERFAAHAWHHGYAQKYLSELEPWASWGDVDEAARAWQACPCGHLFMHHDIEEYDGDGSDMCCVEGCDQTGCPGRAPKQTEEITP